jgi:GR25 family glycosyltransferase involved in LPS biosynthesis
MSICLGWRRGLLFALACTSLFTLTYVLGAPDARTRAADLAHAHVSTLDVAAHIYVASLPRRVDRRRNMTMLANRLGAQFNFVDAVDMHGPAVRNIMNHMRLFRQENPANSSSFAWPESGAQIEPLDWTGPLPAGTHVDESVGVTCNHDDWTPVAPEEAAGWDWMSTGRIACWETHIRILREIASGRGSRWWAPGDEAPIRPADVSLILEDDVDMELDIRKRLAGLWPLLPQTWDMIYFGAHRPVLLVCAPVSQSL